MPGAGRRSRWWSVELLPFQRDIILGIYDSDPPARRVIVSMGRKNAKSCLTAMLLLAAVAGPAFRPNAQVYSSAQSRDQAAIIFGYAAKMVRMDEDLSRAVHVKDTAKELIGLRTGVQYKALSADATTAHGASPALVIHDETGRVGTRRPRLPGVGFPSGPQLRVRLDQQIVEHTDPRNTRQPSTDWPVLECRWVRITAVQRPHCRRQKVILSGDALVQVQVAEAALERRQPLGPPGRAPQLFEVQDRAETGIGLVPGRLGPWVILWIGRPQKQLGGRVIRSLGAIDQRAEQVGIGWSLRADDDAEGDRATNGGAST